MITPKTKRKVFAPGCAMILYKPGLAAKLHSMLIELFGEMDLLMTCCKHDPILNEPTVIINVCPGCDKRFGSLYPNTTTVSLWELLAGSDAFPFPDYDGKLMTILDACPTREKPLVHTAIRTLLDRMNINLTEPQHTRTNSICCGDSFYPLLSPVKVNALMRKRASEMPREDVVVYCVSCIQSMGIGGKTPRYLPDLLLGLETKPEILPTDVWHSALDGYIESH